MLPPKRFAEAFAARVRRSGRVATMQMCPFSRNRPGQRRQGGRGAGRAARPRGGRADPRRARVPGRRARPARAGRARRRLRRQRPALRLAVPRDRPPHGPLRAGRVGRPARAGRRGGGAPGAAGAARRVRGPARLRARGGRIRRRAGALDGRAGALHPGAARLGGGGTAARLRGGDRRDLPRLPRRARGRGARRRGAVRLARARRPAPRPRGLGRARPCSSTASTTSTRSSSTRSTRSPTTAAWTWSPRCRSSAGARRSRASPPCTSSCSSWARARPCWRRSTTTTRPRRAPPCTTSSAACSRTRPTRSTPAPRSNSIRGRPARGDRAGRRAAARPAARRRRAGRHRRGAAPPRRRTRRCSSRSSAPTTSRSRSTVRYRSGTLGSAGDCWRSSSARSTRRRRPTTCSPGCARPGLLRQPGLADRLEAQVRRDGTHGVARGARDLGARALEAGGARPPAPGGRGRGLPGRAGAPARAAVRGPLPPPGRHPERARARRPARLRGSPRRARPAQGVVEADPRTRLEPDRVLSVLRELRVHLGEPPQPDRVQVAKPEAIRARRFHAVFVCGLQEGEFPRGARAGAVPARRGPPRHRARQRAAPAGPRGSARPRALPVLPVLLARGAAAGAVLALERRGGQPAVAVVLRGGRARPARSGRRRVHALAVGGHLGDRATRRPRRSSSARWPRPGRHAARRPRPG